MKNISSKIYLSIALGLAVVCVILVIWIVRTQNLQSQKSGASYSILCVPTDIISLADPNGGQTYTAGANFHKDGRMNIVWDQNIDYTQPVTVSIWVARVEQNGTNPITTGHCSDIQRNQYQIASSVPSVPGRNQYDWDIPANYPASASGDNLIIRVSTNTYINGRQNNDMTDGTISIRPNKHNR